uniref:Solute carrier family 10 member 4 n=1 Tax=Amazona collaria TaxID=241587 RepID=A0A8B9F3G5_9PSIT
VTAHRRVAPRGPGCARAGLSVLVGLALCVTMLGLGCAVELGQLGHQLRRPVGLLLALLGQFVAMPLLAFLLALIFALDEVAAVAVLLCGCCPGGNLSNLMSVLVDGDMNLSIIMTASSTLLALFLMPLCLWIYSHPWINTAVVQLLPLGAVSLTLGSTLLPIGLGVLIRYRYPRVGRGGGGGGGISLWSLLVTLVILFILTGTMLGPDLMAHIPASVYAIAVLMPLAGYALGYGLATVFKMPPHCRRTVSLETGCQNVQLCTAILKLTFPPELIGSMYMFPLLYALFQSAEAGLFVLVYKIFRQEKEVTPGGTCDVCCARSQAGAVLTIVQAELPGLHHFSSCSHCTRCVCLLPWQSCFLTYRYG